MIESSTMLMLDAKPDPIRCSASAADLAAEAEVYAYSDTYEVCACCCCLNDKVRAGSASSP